jgi:hypothetical protein
MEARNDIVSPHAAAEEADKALVSAIVSNLEEQQRLEQEDGAQAEQELEITRIDYSELISLLQQAAHTASLCAHYDRGEAYGSRCREHSAWMDAVVNIYAESRKRGRDDDVDFEPSKTACHATHSHEHRHRQRVAEARPRRYKHAAAAEARRDMQLGMCIVHIDGQQHVQFTLVHR